jgi:hypothetical protein
VRRHIDLPQFESWPPLASSPSRPNNSLILLNLQPNGRRNIDRRAANSNYSLLTAAAVDEVTHAGEKLRVGAKRRRPIDIFRRACQPFLAGLIRAAGLTCGDRGTKVAGEAPAGEHRCVQAQPLEHLAHISPAVVCVANVGQDLPLRKIGFIGRTHRRVTKWRRTGFDLAQTTGDVTSPQDRRVPPPSATGRARTSVWRADNRGPRAPCESRLSAYDHARPAAS